MNVLKPFSHWRCTTWTMSFFYYPNYICQTFMVPYPQKVRIAQNISCTWFRQVIHDNTPYVVTYICTTQECTYPSIIELHLPDNCLLFQSISTKSYVYYHCPANLLQIEFKFQCKRKSMNCYSLHNLAA